MKKTIYHGSNHIIEKPQYGYGKPYNDYGVGFYCTENPNMAKEWGVSIDHNGYANEYQIECDGLTILDLNAPEYTMLHWLTQLSKAHGVTQLAIRDCTVDKVRGKGKVAVIGAISDNDICRFVVQMKVL